MLIRFSFQFDTKLWKTLFEHRWFWDECFLQGCGRFLQHFYAVFDSGSGYGLRYGIDILFKMFDDIEEADDSHSQNDFFQRWVEFCVESWAELSQMVSLLPIKIDLRNEKNCSIPTML